MEIFFDSFGIDGKIIRFERKKFAFNPNIGYYRELKKVLKIKRADNVELIRVGNAGDGGYIMADDFLKGGGDLFFRNF